MNKYGVEFVCALIPNKIKREKVKNILLNPVAVEKIAEVRNANFPDVRYEDDNLIINSFLNASNENVLRFNNNVCFIFRNIVAIGTVVGRYSYIGEYTKIDQKVKIGKYCSIANNVLIGATSHPLNWLSTSPFQYDDWLGEDCNKKRWEISKNTIIENDVWIGANVVIKSGVKIGNGAVVASGAVVVEDIPPYAVVGGVPARIIKYRFDENTIKKLLDIKWWNLSHESIKKLPFDNISKCFEVFCNEIV